MKKLDTKSVLKILTFETDQTTHSVHLKVLTAKLSFKSRNCRNFDYYNDMTARHKKLQKYKIHFLQLVWFIVLKVQNFGFILPLENCKLLWKFPLSRKIPFSTVYSLSTPDLEPWILADHRRRFANLCRKCGRSSPPNHTLIGSHYMEMQHSAFKFIYYKQPITYQVCQRGYR